MKGNQSLPFNSRPMEQWGTERGSGIPGKTGKKKGGFASNVPLKSDKTGKPPKKF